MEAVLTRNVPVREGTFFSQERCIQAVARTETAKSQVLKLQIANTPAHMFGLERIHKFGRRTVWLAPFGENAYPVHAGDLEECVPLLVEQLKTFRTVKFEWNVRFDHGGLADQLERCGLCGIEKTTQIIDLDLSYEVVFRKYSPTTRNLIRQADRKGVVIRRTTSSADVSTYYTLYQKVIAERDTWNLKYNKALYAELLTLEEDITLLVAELDGTMIAGVWFVRDGNSFYYWSGAMNYEFKRLFPYYAIINEGIRLACSEGMNTFNFGGSGGVVSLEQFKASWGSRTAPRWTFVWENPIWSSISETRRRISWSMKREGFKIPG